MDLAARVLSRWKRAGGSSFENYVPKTDPKAAFSEAVQDAQHESGHGGYSGTIAEKSGFTIRRHQPMTREQAREFINDDIEKNDKWGPAYAVPIAEAEKAKEKKFKVKVPARDQHATYEPAEKAVKEKFPPEPGEHVVIKIEKSTLVKEGKLPELKLEKGGPEGFKIVGPGTKAQAEGWTAGKVWASRTEAVQGLKEFILSRKPREGDKYEIVKFKTSDTFTIGDVTKSMHLFEVEGTVSVQKPSTKIVGWVFYGIASS
jgi:hypothetical protein